MENAHECRCGNEIQSSGDNTPVAESDCNMPCAGDKSETCGARARMYLYKYVIPPTGSWLFLGCYGEEDPRILRHQLELPGGMNNNTRQNCIDTCDKQGHSYAGAENSNQCFCDNLINPPGQLAPDGATGW